MTQQLLIVRHGETASNVARILQTPDIPLSQRGRQQADRLAQRLTEAPIGLILTSDYQRAMDTTQAIVAATGAPTRVSPLLRERNFGDWRGRPYADFDFDPHDLDRSPPGGESWEIFYRRAARAFEMIEAVAAETSGRLVVVTHGLVCKALTNRHLAPEGGYDHPWANTSVTEASGPPWKLERVNCALHLDDLGEGGAPA